MRTDIELDDLLCQIFEADRTLFLGITCTFGR